MSLLLGTWGPFNCNSSGGGGVGGGTIQILIGGNRLGCKPFYTQTRGRGGEANQSHLNND